MPAIIIISHEWTVLCVGRREEKTGDGVVGVALGKIYGGHCV